MRYVIIAITAADDDFAVYACGTGERGEFGTPLVKRGRLHACIAWRKNRTRRP